MVRCFSFALAMLVMVASPAAFALLNQTQKDLRAVEDRLRYEFGSKEDGGRGGAPPLFPMLIAPPQADWEESKTDFAPEMRALLTRVFPQSGALIDCQECYSNRVFVARDNRMVVQNGELSLSDLARLKAHPGYTDAKSIFMSRETPSGIEILVLAIDDGRILYAGVEDANKTLEDAEPPLQLARELERRERGQALTYVLIDAGLYPSLALDLKWLEQWGSRNQNLSGVAISLLHPTGAVGASYYYMLPFKRQATIGATLYYSLRTVFQSSTDQPDQDFIGSLSLNYAISGSYGVFASADTTGVYLIGITLQNPVLFPFLF